MELSSSKIKEFLIFSEMELSSPKLIKLLYFWWELEKPEKKSALKKCFVSYDVFAIFTAVKHSEILCEAKIQHRDRIINNLIYF